MRIYIKAYRWIFPKMPSEVFYECSKDLELFEKLCREDIMTEEQFTVTQNGDFFTVRDTVKNKPMGLFEFKENEFPVYACFQKIIDKMNELAEENRILLRKNGAMEEEIECLTEENDQLKSDNFNLNKSVEYLDETVKEQCNKIDWADECGVRWEEEYEKWKG